MNTNEQEPKQVTLTNEWMNTKRMGRDDYEIERDAKKSIADRKRNNREKVYARRQRPKKGEDEEEVVADDVNLSALTTTEMLEAVVDEEEEVVEDASSYDSAFADKLISPRAKRRLHSAMATPPSSNTKSEARTPPTTTVRNQSHSSNVETKYTKQLNEHIRLQNRIIHELRQKIALIRDISNDSKKFDNNEMKKKIVEKDVISIPTIDKNTTITPVVSEGKNIITLHIH